MRWIGWLMLLVIVVTWVAIEIPAGSSPSEGQTVAAWRRTNHGWERTTSWMAQGMLRQPALHPLVVGLLELLLTVTALVAFAWPEQSSADRGDPFTPLGSRDPCPTRPYHLGMPRPGLRPEPVRVVPFIRLRDRRRG